MDLSFSGSSDGDPFSSSFGPSGGSENGLGTSLVLWGTEAGSMREAASLDTGGVVNEVLSVSSNIFITGAEGWCVVLGGCGVSS